MFVNEPIDRYQGGGNVYMNYLKFSVYNVVNKHLSINNKIVKMKVSKKKTLSKKALSKSSNFNFKLIKNKKRFRKKVLEIIDANIYKDIPIYHKEYILCFW